MAVNKVQKSTGEVLIDLTADTVTPDTLLKGETAHGADGVQFTGTMEAASGPGIPTELCPQIVCADNHLRDIVIEEDGKAYIRIGFFDVTSSSRTIDFSVTEDIVIHHFKAIGAGGYGATATNGAKGKGGYAGEQKVGSNLKLTAGARYYVHCGFDFKTELVKNLTSIITAANGTTATSTIPTDSSNASGAPGQDGYMLDLQPTGVAFMPDRLEFYDAKTGAGIGAGGAGGSIYDSSMENDFRHGLGGGVFLYVPLQ